MCTYVCVWISYIFDFDTFCYHFFWHFLIRSISAKSITVCIHSFGFGSNTLMHLSKCFPAKKQKQENRQLKDLFKEDNITSNIDVRDSDEKVSFNFTRNFVMEFVSFSFSTKIHGIQVHKSLKFNSIFV